MRRSTSTKDAALKAIRQGINNQPIFFDDYQSLMAILETDDSKLESLTDLETMYQLDELKCEARKKSSCKNMLRMLIKTSKKIRKAKIKKIEQNKTR